MKLIVQLFLHFFRNPNAPFVLAKTWPQYTSERREYLGLSPNLTVRSNMRPDKMALWNEYLPSLASVDPTTASPQPTTADTSQDNKGLYSTMAVECWISCEAKFKDFHRYPARNQSLLAMFWEKRRE